MGTPIKTFKISMAGLGFTFLAALMLMLSPSSWAAPPAPTICKAGAERNATGDKAKASTAVQNGENLTFSFTTLIDNAGAKTNVSRERVAIQAPRPGCSFEAVIINTDTECSPLPNDQHPVQVQFACNDGGQELYNLDVEADADAIIPPSSLEDDFNRTTALLGLNISFPASCGEGGDGLDCAEAVCNEIKNQIENGDSLALSTAGDLSGLYRTQTAVNSRCFFNSNYAVIDSGGAGCTGDDVASTVALDVLLSKPEFDATATGDANGTLRLDNNDGTGDFASINLDTCFADAQVTE